MSLSCLTGNNVLTHVVMCAYVRKAALPAGAWPPRTAGVTPWRQRGELSGLSKGAIVANKALDAAKRRAMSRIPNEQLVCRVRAHRWPDVDLGNNRAETGIVSVYNTNLGVFEQTEICERCGKQRHRVTLPPGIYPTLSDGIFVPGSRWTYSDPDNWERFTVDDDISRGDLISEYDYRAREKFYKRPRGASPLRAVSA